MKHEYNVQYKASLDNVITVKCIACMQLAPHLSHSQTGSEGRADCLGKPTHDGQDTL